MKDDHRNGSPRRKTSPDSAGPRLCPHCDSPHTQQMKDRAYEQQSATTWYQCVDCGRMWSVPKPPPGRVHAADDNSPQS